MDYLIFRPFRVSEILPFSTFAVNFRLEEILAALWNLAYTLTIFSPMHWSLQLIDSSDVSKVMTVCSLSTGKGENRPFHTYPNFYRIYVTPTRWILRMGKVEYILNKMHFIWSRSVEYPRRCAGLKFPSSANMCAQNAVVSLPGEAGRRIAVRSL